MGDGTYEAADSIITAHLPSPAKATGAAVVICPGGGYGGRVVGPEGHLIARWLNEHGIAGIVLEYRLPRGRPFVPLLDAQRAIRTTRAKAKEWRIDPKRIGNMGFSAGGHGLNGYRGPMWDAWQKRSLEWLAEQGLAPSGNAATRQKSQ